MISDNEANAVMSRVVRMPFYHRYVTLELTKRSREDGKEADEMNTEPVYTKIEETGTLYNVLLIILIHSVLEHKSLSFSCPDVKK